MMGFEPLINQRLLPPTFPRYTKIRSREDTVDYFTGLIHRLSQFTGIVPLSDNLHALIVSSTVQTYIQCNLVLKSCGMQPFIVHPPKMQSTVEKLLIVLIII